MAIAQEFFQHITEGKVKVQGYAEPEKMVLGEYLARAIYGPLRPHLGHYEKTFESRLTIARKGDGFFGYDERLKSKIYILTNRNVILNDNTTA